MATKRFGQKLRMLRGKQNMSMRELAEVVGYTSHAYIYKVETGQRKPSLELVMKVAKLFDVSADVLLDDDRELE